MKGNLHTPIACVNLTAIWLTDSLSTCIESTCTQHAGATSHAIGRQVLNLLCAACGHEL